MKIPYRLSRRPSGHPASALLVLGHDSSRILDLCVRLGLGLSGRVFAVAGGLLLKLDGPRPETFPQAIRLRKLAENLLIPVDAELIPALLDDEASGLTRDRGLIFLPGGEVLGFDPRSPVDPSALLTCKLLPRKTWRSLPDPPRLADRIEEIRMDSPGLGPDDPPGDVEDAVLGPGNEDIGSEKPRPGASGAASGAIGRAAMGAGKGMMWLGNALGMKGLAGLGAGWVRRAVDMAPRLGESVFGRQAAALRELLREFREGDPERALRHALPMGDHGSSRGAGIDSGSYLPPQDTSYNLAALLRNDDSGPGGLWMGGQDVMAQLVREYHQAAERAMKRGDYRRAAFIYGKLLRDFRLAAHALVRGGHYRDAASLFLARLDDPKSAALALESAGELDRAIEIYRRVGEHEAAGDLLRKIGEEDAAIAEFRLAADRLAASNAGHLAAGDFLWKKTGRADLALNCFREGWDRRPLGNAILCASRIARHHAEANDVPRLLQIIDEAEAHFTAHGDDYLAGKFYEEIALLADRPDLAESREELRDRALMGVARRLRDNAEKVGPRPKKVLSRLMGDLETWTPAVVRDAEFALANASHEMLPNPSASASKQPTDRLGIVNERVTAAAFAPAGDEIFFGFESGQVVCFRPRNDEIVLVTGQGWLVEALAASADGRNLVILQTRGAAEGRLNTYERKPDGTYRPAFHLAVEIRGGCWITPVVASPAGDRIGFFDGEHLGLVEVAGLTRQYTDVPPGFSNGPLAGFLFPYPDRPVFETLMHDGNAWHRYDPQWGSYEPLDFGGALERPVTPAIRNIACQYVGPDQYEIAWIAPHGRISCGLLQVKSGECRVLHRATSGQKGGYEAVVIVRPGVAAGIARDRIDWFHTRATTLSPLHTVACDFESIGAGFPSRRTGELIVIDGFGRIRRVDSQ